MRVLIAGGGTGGHSVPGHRAGARAACGAIRRREVSFVGTAQGIEARVVPREGFPLDLIRVAGLERQVAASSACAGSCCCRWRPLDAWRVLSKRRPDVVVGVGGFASGPVLALAALRGYPTMLLEQNALPGITNRLLARVVRAAAVNFETALAYFPRTGFVAGNPVRPEFFPAQNEEANDSRVRRDRRDARGTGPDLWRFSGGARDQRGHGGGSVAAGSLRDTPCDHPPDRRARSGSGAHRVRNAPGWRPASRPSSTKSTER